MWRSVSFYLIAIFALRVKSDSLQERNVLIVARQDKKKKTNKQKTNKQAKQNKAC